MITYEEALKTCKKYDIKPSNNVKKTLRLISNCKKINGHYQIWEKDQKCMCELCLRLSVQELLDMMNKSSDIKEDK